MDQRKQSVAVKKAVKAIAAILDGLPDTEAMEEVVLEVYHKYVLVQNDRYELAGMPG